MKNVIMRIFVAVEISDEEILHSIKKLQDRLQIQAKAVELKNMHFTLQFIGEVDAGDCEKIKKELKKVVFTAFEVKIQGVGAFPKPRSPRVIWVGTNQSGADMLKELTKKIAGVLAPLGFKQDKAFMPHLTIFRIKSRIRDMTAELNVYKEQRFGKMTVSEIKLKHSKLTPTGPVYSDLGAYGAN